jgi:ribosomal protein S18 acetylase RimI-like enzyme
MYELLDNIMWNTLSGRHAHYSTGTAAARRYARGFSPIVGFPDPENPNFQALAPYCQSGEHFYCDKWTGKAPSGWQVDTESTMFKMVWAGDPPTLDEAPDAMPLGSQHVAQALELAELTRPGPFGPRTIELGNYFGCFDGNRLVAMAGERLHAGSLREVSGVCTHPDFRGKGLARRLMMKLIQQELLRGETPFLHVMNENQNARALYERMGFRNYRETIVRVISHV